MNSDLNRVEELLEQALTRSESDRTAFLAEACEGDKKLREEVESLLAMAGNADGFLDTLVAGERDAPAEEPGTVIGHFKLLQKIGEGGFGTVYMADQEAPIRRRVALKIIKAGMDTKQVVARFEAERQALAMMDHTNIARVFDGGSTESGRSYFAMELVKGVPITQYCDEQKLTTEERLRLFMDVCSAVQHAHQKGVIHRDLKPSNVLVTLYDGRPVPKVIDFGIAKAIDQRLTDKTLFTQFEQMIGTPDFMSPEQAKMSGLDVDTRSDIYSLGVLLYVLLTGQKPFDWGQTGLDEIRRRIKEEDPPKPSTRVNTLGEDQLTTTARHRNSDGVRLQSQLRGDLDWIVMKAIEKDRTRRYETANAFRLDLERYLNHELVSAVAPSFSYRLSKFVRRNRAAVLMGGAAAVVLTVATIVSSISTFWALSESKTKQSVLDQLQIEQGKTRAALDESRRSEAALVKQSVALEAARDEARLNQYAADMRNAQVALDAGNLEAAERLLLPYRDTPLRGWEWDFLHLQSAGDEHEVLGKIDARVAHLEGVSDDGERLLIMTVAGEIMVWDVIRRRVVWKKEYRGGIYHTSVAWKGNLIALGSVHSPGIAPQIWDYRRDKLVWKAEEKGIVNLDLSPTDPWVAVNDGMSLRVFDYLTGKTVFVSHQRGMDPSIAALELSRKMNHQSPVSFSQDGERVARALAGKEFVEVWETATWERVVPPTPVHDHSIERTENGIKNMSFGIHGELILTFIYGSPMIFDVQNLSLRQPIRNRDLWALQLSRDGEHLVGGGTDHAVHIFSADTYELVRTLRGHRGELSKVVFSPEGDSLYSIDYYGNIFRWPWPNHSQTKEQVLSAPEVEFRRPVLFDPHDEDMVWLTHSSLTQRNWI